MESKLLDWALTVVDKLPPVPARNLVAFLLIAVMLFGVARKAMRVTQEPEAALDPKPMVLLDPTAVYTMLTNIEIAVNRLNGRVETMEQMLRRRQKPVRNRKKKAPPSAEPVD